MLQWHELTVCRHFRHVTRCWRTGCRLLFLSITTWCRGIPAKRHNGNLSNTFPTEHKQNLLGWSERVVHIQVDKLSSLFPKRGTYDNYQNKQTFAHLAPVSTNMNNVHLSQKIILNVFQEKDKYQWTYFSEPWEVILDLLGFWTVAGSVGRFAN